jgi:alpha-glucosidase
LQLIYDAQAENNRTGKPISRPLFMNEIQPGVFTEDPASSLPHDWGYEGYISNRVDDQLFLGRDMLVAPIVNPGQTNRPVYLPKGNVWYAFTYDRIPLGFPVLGGTEVDFYAPWNDVNKPNCPIFVREGAILPLREVEQYIGELHKEGKQNPITLSIYPGRDNKYTMYLDDDGVTRDAETKDKYRLVEVGHEAITFGKRIAVKRTFDKYQPPETYYYVGLLGTTRPKKVTIDGVTQKEVTGSNDEEHARHLHESTDDGYYYNYSLETTFLKKFDNQAETVMEVLF